MLAVMLLYDLLHDASHVNTVRVRKDSPCLLWGLLMLLWKRANQFSNNMPRITQDAPVVADSRISSPVRQQESRDMMLTPRQPSPVTVYPFSHCRPVLCHRYVTASLLFSPPLILATAIPILSSVARVRLTRQRPLSFVKPSRPVTPVSQITMAASALSMESVVPIRT